MGGRTSLFRSIIQNTRKIKSNLFSKGTFPALLDNVIDCFLGEKLYFIYPILGLGQSNESKVLTHIVKSKTVSGNIALDIGSCRGMYALWLSKTFSKVYAFEPNDENYKILKMIIRLRRKKNIEVLKLAVADKQGVGRLYINDSIFGHSLDHNYCPATNFTSTRIINLNNFVKQPIDFIKVDVQGVSFKVIEGASEVMPKIRQWIIELEEAELNNKPELETLMKSCGYETLWLSEQHLYAFKPD